MPTSVKGQFIDLVLVLLALHLLSPEITASDLRYRFLKEAPAAWREYRRHANASYQGSFERILERTRRALDRSRIEIKQNASCRMVSFTDTSPAAKKLPSQVQAFNSKYWFLISNPGNGGWMVNETVLAEHHGYTSRQRKLDEAFTRLYDPILCYDYALMSVVEEPGFHVEDVAEEHRDGQKIVVLVFKIVQSKKDNNATPIRSGKLFLDPSSYWVLRSYKVQVEHPFAAGVAEATVQWRVCPHGYPVPVKRVERRRFTRSNGSQVSQRWQYDFHIFEAERPPPESAFTLTAFGLPEPPGVDWTPPTPWYVYAGAAGIVLFALCFGVWKQRLRCR